MRDERASRSFDRDRDGFVIAGGGGMLVLESLEHAEARGAEILAELIGYAATSDGYDMVAPSGEGAQRCINLVFIPVKGDPGSTGTALDCGLGAEVEYRVKYGPSGTVWGLDADTETSGDVTRQSVSLFFEVPFWRDNGTFTIGSDVSGDGPAEIRSDMTIEW